MVLETHLVRAQLIKLTSRAIWGKIQRGADEVQEHEHEKATPWLKGHLPNPLGVPKGGLVAGPLPMQ
jgi:hypothetical protein